jgi:DNA polymerase III epsilon subunit-like protein
LETTIPQTDMIEFGAIVIDSLSFCEVQEYSTLVQLQRGKITKRSIACNGISESMLARAPRFEQVADHIFAMMNDQVWCGHNIVAFDNEVLRKQFERVGRVPPKPRAVIDTLALLRRHYGSERAGNLKIDTLARHYALGAESHRSIDDCRMTLEILKRASLTLFLEQHTLLYDSSSSLSSSSDSSSSNANVEKKKKNVAVAASSSAAKAKTKMKTTPTTRKDEPQPEPAIVDMIDRAIKEKSTVYILYQVGRQPKRPRAIQPRAWLSKPRLISANCLLDNMVKKFLTYRILEVHNNDEEKEKHDDEDKPEEEHAKTNQ